MLEALDTKQSVNPALSELCTGAVPDNVASNASDAHSSTLTLIIPALAPLRYHCSISLPALRAESDGAGLFFRCASVEHDIAPCK